MESAMNLNGVISAIEEADSFTDKTIDVYSSANYIFETSEHYHKDLINKYYAR
jgi:hypothetical protein